MSEQSRLTDRRILARRSYGNEKGLVTRRSIYEYAVPRYIIQEEVVGILQPRGDETILDIGCGDGSLLIYLREGGHGGSLFGIDISSGILSKPRVQSERKGLNIIFAVADAQSLPFPNETFDMVTACHMIYHVPDIPRALNEMRRVLKPGGRIVVTTNSRESKAKFLQPLKKRVSKAFHFGPSPDSTARFNTEEGGNVLRQYFKNVRLVLFASKIIAPGEVYLAYFDTLRPLWERDFSSKEWREVLEFVRKEIERTLGTNGNIEDQNIFGIFLGEK